MKIEAVLYSNRISDETQFGEFFIRKNGGGIFHNRGGHLICVCNSCRKRLAKFQTGDNGTDMGISGAYGINLAAFYSRNDFLFAPVVIIASPFAEGDDYGILRFFHKDRGLPQKVRMHQ